VTMFGKKIVRYHHQKNIIICVNHQGCMLVNFSKKSGNGHQI
jgi:hypothetical protein